LEKEGVIKKYTIEIDHKKIGKEIQAYILLTVNYSLPSGKKIHQMEVARSIRSFSEVEEVKILAGVTDILIRVRTHDIDELNNFVINKLREIDGVDKTQTMIVLNEL
ncbi:MAG: Lrp/AsnC family transcriptional regulator, partial [Candidatus Bathyarchaeia archaeon]